MTFGVLKCLNSSKNVDNHLAHFQNVPDLSEPVTIFTTTFQKPKYNTMKSNFPIYLFLIIGFFFIACKSQRYSADKLPDQQLLFGSGGGFTGDVTEYILLDNGQLFKKSSLKNTMTEMGQIKQKEAKQLMKEVEQLNLEKIKVSESGNMYYFVCMKNGDTEHKTTWGSATYEVDSTVQALHKKLMKAAGSAPAPVE